ncbi:Putative lipoprotein OS=Pseudoalteromonas tunicata D2 GN=PTD2_17540 PE=4 SV=1 [Gemmata massiliana]|uniref:SGNH/GDSL hydrolase family protein n=1 Tax=Gemmata massiliana TaxID=1210884 RepID=A0A6P2CZY6_9BACT|nr:hypothetical protein [Gemmata massiliana]VTR94561.1 Putative lipoprotein OS=Pseudoalteromonas tunicata D2 GN=PTD2_17540 PE=4 SV=1 [Gemmata massiliana]
MRPNFEPFALCLVFPVLTGCGCSADQPPAVVLANPPNVISFSSVSVPSNPSQVRAADYSILFVGNSHTSGHNLPGLVSEMIRFRKPGKTTYAHVLSVGFLEDVEHNPTYREEIESRPWKFVVLQAQKISTSGKHEYSRNEGIDLAKRAKKHGANVFFFSEWGLKDKPGDGPRQEKVYAEMARAAGVNLAGVGRAWDVALSERPNLTLYEADGNHQSPVGAFLTAAFLCGKITGECPETLGTFPDATLGEADRKFLAQCAAKAVKMP